jgi:hypothetical protein
LILLIPSSIASPIVMTPMIKPAINATTSICYPSPTVGTSVSRINRFSLPK